MERIYKFKAYNKTINFPSQFCLGNISNKLEHVESEEVSLKGNLHDFSADYEVIDKSDVLNIDKYLRVKNNKIMFWRIKQVFIVLLSFSRSSTTKCVSLSDKPCMARTTVVVNRLTWYTSL